jgi:predicted DNA binding CopG/RHH family protein
MQQSGSAPSSPNLAGFASLLSNLMAPSAAAKPQPAAKAQPEWNDDELAEDVATLSYESALRSHSRYSPKGAEEAALDAGDDVIAKRLKAAFAKSGSTTVSAPASQPVQAYELRSDDEEQEPIQAQVQAQAKAATALPRSAQKSPTPFERNLKRSSITIRMSEEECAQLHRRAAEAGLTVSAYLRSCTFEAEALRAQVKEVLAQLSANAEETAPAANQPKKFGPASAHQASADQNTEGNSGLGWLKRLIPQARKNQQAMRA